jgi:hypothetical protein
VPVNAATPTAESKAAVMTKDFIGRSCRMFSRMTF